jgi:hypothetical protein
MKGNKLSKFGGICSILVGISYIVIGITFLLGPVEQRPGSDSAAFLISFAQTPLMSILMYWAFALGAVFAIAAVLAVSEMVLTLSEGWVRWTSNLAIIGFAVTALNNFRSLGYYPTMAATYATGDAVTKAAIEASQYVFDLDPNGWLIFGGVGLWFLVVNLLALSGNSWPKILSYVGIAGAIAYWLVVAGYVFQIYIFISVAAAASIVIAPIWYIWAGLRLQKATS